MMWSFFLKKNNYIYFISVIVKNLTKVITEWEDLHLIGEDDKEELGKLVQDALDSALKLKGDI